MSESKPVVKTLVFDDPAAPGEDKNVAVATLSAMKLVVRGNYADLRDAQDKTVATLTWPTKYKVREI